MTHICVSKLTIIASDNGLSPGRRQAIIWSNAGILLIGIPGTNFSEIVTKIQTFSVKKMHLKMAFAKWRPFCLGLNVLILQQGMQYPVIVDHVMMEHNGVFRVRLWGNIMRLRQNGCCFPDNIMLWYVSTFCITGLFRRESASHQWIPLTESQ